MRAAVFTSLFRGLCSVFVLLLYLLASAVWACARRVARGGSVHVAAAARTLIRVARVDRCADARAIARAVARPHPLAGGTTTATTEEERSVRAIRVEPHGKCAARRVAVRGFEGIAVCATGCAAQMVASVVLQSHCRERGKHPVREQAEGGRSLAERARACGSAPAARAPFAPPARAGERPPGRRAASARSSAAFGASAHSSAASGGILVEVLPPAAVVGGGSVELREGWWQSPGA